MSYRNYNDYGNNKPNYFARFIMTILFFAIIAGGVYLKFTPEFEQDKPIINIDDNIFWNFKSKVKLKIEDASGIKYYKITYRDGAKIIELNSAVLDGNVITNAKIIASTNSSGNIDYTVVRGQYSVNTVTHMPFLMIKTILTMLKSLLFRRATMP